jgi:hypothetical protein
LVIPLGEKLAARIDPSGGISPSEIHVSAPSPPGRLRIWAGRKHYITEYEGQMILPVSEWAESLYGRGGGLSPDGTRLAVADHAGKVTVYSMKQEGGAMTQPTDARTDDEE